MLKNDQLYALIITAVIAAVMLTGITLLPHNTSISHTQTLVHSNGLELMLSTSPSTIKQGDKIIVNISLVNTLHSYNLVHSSSYWPNFIVSLGSCDNLPYPLGIAILRGYYTLSNISGAENPLIIFRPSICPMFILYINAYYFYPFGFAPTTPGLINGTYQIGSYMISKQFAFSGYYTYNVSNANPGSTFVFNEFNPGIYTVIGADEWGGIVILHFQVNGNQ
ncbi:MAG: hypothetical protein ACP5TZ_04425 [Nitrososphaeria archaeon]